LRLSRDAVELIVRTHVATAAKACPSLRKKRVTPHVLRHSAAMQLLQNGVDRVVIALWLGHESVETTQMYIHADIQLKEKAMARTRPVKTLAGRYRPSDKLPPSWKLSDYAICGPKRPIYHHKWPPARHNSHIGIMLLMRYRHKKQGIRDIEFLADPTLAKYALAATNRSGGHASAHH